MNARGNWLHPFTLVVLVFLACGRLTASETAGPNGGHRATARPWYLDPAWQIGGGVAAGVVLLAGVVRLLSRNGDRRLAALRAELEQRLLRDGLESPLTVADDVRAVSSMVENAVARLTAENATLRFLSDHHPDGFVLLDRSGVVSRANPAALRLLGGTERDVPGQRLDRWLSPREPGDALATLLTKAAPRTPAIRDTELAATSGTRRLVRVSAWSLSDAGHEGFAVLLHDLTDQTQARESLRRYELVFQHISDAVILTDLESRIIDWNPAATRTFGHERQDVLGRTTELLSHVQNRQLVTTQIISGVMSQGRWSGEIPFVRHDGSAGVSESVVVPLLDANGRRVATVGVHRDVTGRKRVEERLRESEARYRLLAEQASDMLARRPPAASCSATSRKSSSAATPPNCSTPPTRVPCGRPSGRW
jgi:PAS domain S-box-containing protein